ncbi:MAG: CDC48 family AAA ATPase [Candidatus Woesearchaeota archaeon]
MREAKLKVAEAIQDDVNKGIVRMDSGFMHDIGVRPGDIVEIEGERKTVGIVDRSYPGDIGLKIIRMDGIVRRNAKTGIGETVVVRKADVKEAKKIVIAPAQKGIMVRVSPHLLKQGLLGRAAVKGDIISLGGTSRRRTAMGGSPFFDDIFASMLDEGVQSFGFSDIKFIVVDTMPKQPVIITELTEIVFNPEAVEVREEKVLEVTYEDIGGLGDEIKKIREMVELPLKHPEIFERLGIEPPKGVLLHGPPGTGKTLLAKAVANETASNFYLINGPEIMSKFYGQSEANLRKKFEDAEKNAPSIVFIDEIDSLAPKREESYGEVERRVVAQLLALMDGLKSRGRVVVIAATNIPDVLDPALRRPGRFDREIEIGVPSKEGRLSILKIHTRNMPLFGPLDALRENANIEENYKEAIIDLFANIRDKEGINLRTLDKQIGKYLKDNPDKNKLFSELDYNKIKQYIQMITEDQRIVDLKTIAEITHGFVGADLSALTKEAAMEVLRRLLPEIKLREDEPIPKELLEKLKITQQDMKEALRSVRPSAMREVLVEVPNVKWSDIGGLDDVKQELIEAVEWPIKNPQSFRRLGVSPPKGILIYGPPGTGKTMLGKAVATESQANFILVKGPELLSKWVGESEKAVRKIFKKARQASPTIIFFDEIDSLAPKRDASSDSHVTERVVNQLLTEMDGLEELHDVVIIAATNRPDIIDAALLRPGRFDRLIYTPVPDEKSREEIFKVHTRKMPLKDVSLKELARETEGYVGADIEAVCREAAMLALRDDINTKEVTKKYFDMAMEKVRPSVTKEVEKVYKEMENYLRSAKANEIKEEKPAYMG